MPKPPAKPELSAALNERRRQSSWETHEGVHKARPMAGLSDHQGIEEVATLLSGDIAVALAAEIDELSTYSASFRSALNRAFLRVLRLSLQKTETVLFFHEAVPGYTLMLFKKAQATPWKEAASAQEPSLDGSPEAQAAGVLIGQFFRRTKNRVLTVEHPDALFVFFPASDLRKNVREMGFFQTE